MNHYSNQDAKREADKNTSSGYRTSQRTSAAQSARGTRTAGSRTKTGRSSASGRSSSPNRSTASGRENVSWRSGSGRRPGGRSSARRTRKKRNSPDFSTLLLGGIGALVLIFCAALAFRGCRAKEAMPETKPMQTEEAETTAEEKKEQVLVDGVDIFGMTQEEAQAAVLEKYNWSMKVTYQDKETAVENLMESKVTELLDEIYASELKPGASYSVNLDHMTEAAMGEAALIAGNWSMVAKNGGISGYDKSSGTFTFSEGTNGKVIDQEKLAQAIVEAIEAGEYGKVIEATVKEVSPELTAAQLREKYKTIATYTTTTTSNSNRNENIRLACEALNGTIVKPGQEFSFNDTTGARTEAKGYKPAAAYLNGEVVQEPGGGVCQVSSTLYNAVVFAGLKSTERHAHSYEPSYVTPGEDAAVSYGGPDFKFVNNSDYPIAIKTSFANRELTISLYGVQVLPDGTKIRMESEKTSELDPPEPTYEEDQTLQPDEEKVVKEAVMGTRWTTELVRYENGTEVSREHFHNSTYRGKSAIIRRNTSGVVVTTADPSAESTEEVSEQETEESVSAGPGGLSAGTDESESRDVTETSPESSSAVISPAVPDTDREAGALSPVDGQSPSASAPIQKPGSPVIEAGPGAQMNE